MGLAIITGAAGGMGAPAARRFAARGDALILCEMREDAIEQIAALLRFEQVSLEIVTGDVAAPDFPSRLLAAVGDRAIDAVVHTAGLSPTMADGPRIFEVNYTATEALVNALGPRMAPGGCIVLISSCSAYMVRSEGTEAATRALVKDGDDAKIRALLTSPQAAYPLSKRAVIALVERYAVPLGAHGIRIASISPGFIDTDLGRAEMRGSEQMVAMIAKTPLGRMGTGDEIAAVAAFLCSPDAAYVSGCDIKVDGGALAALGF